MLKKCEITVEMDHKCVLSQGFFLLKAFIIFFLLLTVSAEIAYEIKRESEDTNEDDILASMFIKIENEQLIKNENDNFMKTETKEEDSDIDIDVVSYETEEKTIKLKEIDEKCSKGDTGFKKQCNSKNKELKTRSQQKMVVKADKETSNPLLKWLRREKIENTKTIRKNKTVDRKSRFTCAQCDSTFRTKKLVKKHITLHCNKFYKYACPYCSEYTKFFAYEVYGHIRRHHAGKEVYCINLFDDVSKNSSFKKQYKQKDKPFACSKCPGRFLTEFRLRRHLKYECNVEKKIICDYCLYETKYKSHMTRHCLRMHKECAKIKKALFLS